jgi:hypothetical protein
MIANDKLRTLKKAVVAQFKVLSWYLPGKPEKNDNIPQSRETRLIRAVLHTG